MESKIYIPKAKWDGNLSENQHKSIYRFWLYMMAAGFGAKGAKAKSSLLLTTLGEEGPDIYKTFKLEAVQELQYEAIL